MILSKDCIYNYISDVIVSLIFQIDLCYLFGSKNISSNLVNSSFVHIVLFWIISYLCFSHLKFKEHFFEGPQ